MALLGIDLGLGWGFGSVGTGESGGFADRSRQGEKISLKGDGCYVGCLEDFVLLAGVAFACVAGGSGGFEFAGSRLTGGGGRAGDLSFVTMVYRLC
jgi:hypothetical protein